MAGGDQIASPHGERVNRRSRRDRWPRPATARSTALRSGLHRIWMKRWETIAQLAVAGRDLRDNDMDIFA
jgi:hypothetical protein